ncbi:MAG: hypothetical protein GY839_06525 [candidate division Zixibacteria bacterium]|nr:hypothetical protein [candidate division Zixibacteria bacterium]
MRVLSGLNLFIETYVRIFRGLKSLRLLAPFLILALLKGIILLTLVSFYLPPIHKILIPILGYFYSDRVLHFPHYYLILPQVFKYASSFILELVFGIVLSASAVFIIGADYKHERGGFYEGLRTASKLFLALLVVWLLKTAIVTVIFRYSGNVIFPFLYGMPFADFAGFLIIQMAGLIVSAFLIYAVPAIILQRRNLISAIATSIKFTGRNFFFTFFLLFIPWLIYLPISYFIFSKVHVILNKFNYSVLIYLMAFDILIALITGFFVLAGITYFYLDKTE